jgi:SAM-dependent methyltransferase
MKVCLACDQRFDGAGWTCPVCGEAPADDGRLSFKPYADDLGDAFPLDAAAKLEFVEAESFWFRSRNALLAWALARYFPRARSFLEVGCGTGFVLAAMHERFPDLHVEGAELDPGGLEVARRRLPGVPLYRIDARRIPFDEEFDVVGAFDVVEHIDEDELALHQIARAAKPGGGVLVTVPQHPSLWSVADDLGRHRRRYTRADLIAKLLGAGLRVERITSFVTLLLPAMWLSRRRAQSADDACAEFAIPPRADRWLERTMSVERQLIRAGLSLPAGGSLLAVASTRKR